MMHIAEVVAFWPSHKQRSKITCLQVVTDQMSLCLLCSIHLLFFASCLERESRVVGKFARTNFQLVYIRTSKCYFQSPHQECSVVEPLKLPLQPAGRQRSKHVRGILLQIDRHCGTRLPVTLCLH
ncbi:hypothetical protein ABZP36_014947 [Zizania latifolia]